MDHLLHTLRSCATEDRYVCATGPFLLFIETFNFTTRRFHAVAFPRVSAAVVKSVAERFKLCVEADRARVRKTKRVGEDNRNI